MLTKVFYKPDSQSTGEYSVIVDPVEVGGSNISRHLSHPNMWFIVQQVERR